MPSRLHHPLSTLHLRATGDRAVETRSRGRRAQLTCRTAGVTRTRDPLGRSQVLSDPLSYGGSDPPPPGRRHVPSPRSRVCPRAQRRGSPADGGPSIMRYCFPDFACQTAIYRCKTPHLPRMQVGRMFRSRVRRGHRASAKDLHLRNLHDPACSTSVRSTTSRTPRTGCTRRRRACGSHACP